MKGRIIFMDNTFTEITKFGDYKVRGKTNYEIVISKNPEELAEWFWWMLNYVQGYTDSRIALLDWLNQIEF